MHRREWVILISTWCISTLFPFRRKGQMLISDNLSRIYRIVKSKFSSDKPQATANCLNNPYTNSPAQRDAVHRRELQKEMISTSRDYYLLAITDARWDQPIREELSDDTKRLIAKQVFHERNLKQSTLRLRECRGTMQRMPLLSSDEELSQPIDPNDPCRESLQAFREDMAAVRRSTAIAKAAVEQDPAVAIAAEKQMEIRLAEEDQRRTEAQSLPQRNANGNTQREEKEQGERESHGAGGASRTREAIEGVKATVDEKLSGIRESLEEIKRDHGALADGVGAGAIYHAGSATVSLYLDRFNEEIKKDMNGDAPAGN